MIFFEGYPKDDSFFIYSLVIGILFVENGHLWGGELASDILDRKGMTTNFNGFSVNINIFRLIGCPKNPPFCVIINLYHFHFEFLKSLLQQRLSYLGDGVSLKDYLECLIPFFNLNHVLALKYQLFCNLIILVILLIICSIANFEGKWTLRYLFSEWGYICEI